jgi:hypothetical protein
MLFSLVPSNKHQYESGKPLEPSEPQFRQFLVEPTAKRNAIPAGNRLGLRDGRHRSAIGKRSMQRYQFNTGLTRVPVKHGRILEVLAKHKVRFEEVFVQLGENAWLMSPGPSGSGQGPPRIWEGAEASAEAIQLLWPRAPARRTSFHCEALLQSRPAECRGTIGLPNPNQAASRKRPGSSILNI